MEERMRIMNELPKRTKCPRCSLPNQCALEIGKSIEACWCFGIVPTQKTIDEMEESDACLCKSCLKR